MTIKKLYAERNERKIITPHVVVDLCRGGGYGWRTRNNKKLMIMNVAKD